MGHYMSNIYRSLEEEIDDIKLPQDLNRHSNYSFLSEMRELLCGRAPTHCEDFLRVKT